MREVLNRLCHIMRKVSVSNHAHICSVPLVMFQGSIVWAFQLLDTFQQTQENIKKFESPDNNPLKHGQWHAEDIGKIGDTDLMHDVGLHNLHPYSQTRHTRLFVIRDGTWTTVKMVAYSGCLCHA